MRGLRMSPRTEGFRVGLREASPGEDGNFGGGHTAFPVRGRSGALRRCPPAAETAVHHGSVPGERARRRG